MGQTTVKDNVEKKLQALFDEYAKKLPEKLQTLQAQWDTLRANWSITGLENFHREAHSLSGSSATYGYTALAQGTRQLETYLRILIDKKCELSEENEREITFLLDSLVPTLGLFSREDSSIPVMIPLKGETQKLIFLIDSQCKKNDELYQGLEGSGYELRCFDTIQELKKNLEKTQPIAIIIDIENITEDQTKYLSELKKYKETPVPYICIGSEETLSLRLKGIRMGGEAFFQKPLDSFLLTRMFDQLYESITSQFYRILVIDDSENMAEYHALILQEAGMITATLTDPLQLMQALVDFQPDLLLMDIYMPKCNGLELAAVLRQQPLYTSLPIIFLSKEDDRYKQLSAMMLGGDDFLTKPILPQHLVTAVRSRAKRAGILSSFMMRDSLTELLNHSRLLQELELTLRRAERDQTPLSFVIMDIDHFKAINDTYGHQIEF